MEAVGKTFVIYSKKVQERGVEVVYVGAILFGVVAEFVGCSMCDTSLDATTGQPEAEAFHVMVAPDHTLTALSYWSSAKFTAPYYKGALEETTPLEIGNQTGNGLVY